MTVLTSISQSDANICRAQNVIDEVWGRLRDSFRMRFAEGRSVDSFPDLSGGEAERVATRAASALSSVDNVDIGALPHEVALSVKLLRFTLDVESQATRRHWLAQSYDGTPAMFPVGPYGVGNLFRRVLKTFASFSFSRPSDCDRYLALAEDYADLIDQMRTKLRDQAARGIRIPQPALAGMRALVASQMDAARQQLIVEPTRLVSIASRSGFVDDLARRVESRVLRAFAELLETLGEGYAARAPETVGISQFKEGIEIYEALVAQYLSVPMTVDEVHRAGHDRISQLEDEMADLRGKLGRSNRDEFHHYLRNDPAWIAHSEDELRERFHAAIRRIEPQIEALFRFKPRARYGVARLDHRMETGWTYGFYQKPIAGHPDGLYYFNGSNLADRTLVSAAALIYHELIPGHHFHIASQEENELLHPLRKNLHFAAFNEGWAEYAATLAGEVGMYPNPIELYGRLLNDAFLTCRLIVDTGMNAFGWSLETARQYLRDHTVLSEAEIHSETLRYSTDIPAQSLCYKIGEMTLHDLRERARSSLGKAFDIRDFHDAVLGSGAMPLGVLDWHIDVWLDAKRDGASRKPPGGSTRDHTRKP
jgi:uncharacterized protein (DUF885 family)